MNKETVINRITSIIEGLCGKKIVEESVADTRYLDCDYLDSMAIVEFIIAIEDAFNTNLDPQDTESEEFRTIGGLADILISKQG